MISSFSPELLSLAYSFKIVHKNMNISFILYIVQNNIVMRNTFMFMIWHLRKKNGKLLSGMYHLVFLRRQVPCFICLECLFKCLHCKNCTEKMYMFRMKVHTHKIIYTCVVYNELRKTGGLY